VFPMHRFPKPPDVALELVPTFGNEARLYIVTANQALLDRPEFVRSKVPDERKAAQLVPVFKLRDRRRIVEIEIPQLLEILRAEVEMVHLVMMNLLAFAVELAELYIRKDGGNREHRQRGHPPLLEQCARLVARLPAQQDEPHKEVTAQQ